MNKNKFEIAAQQLRKPFGELAESFAERMNQGNYNLYHNTLSAIQINDNSTILEIGMGNGYFTQDIISKARKIKYHGCDYSPEMIDAANKLNSDLVEKGTAKFHLANAHNLPFKDDNFDLVLSVNTIYFWDNFEQLFTEFSRVMKKNAHLVLAIRPSSSMQYYPFVDYGFTFYSKRDLKNLIEKYSFKIKLIIEREEPSQIIDNKELKVDSLIAIITRI